MSFPTTAVFNINGELSTWGISNPKGVPNVIKAFEVRGHNIKLIRAVTDTSIPYNKTGLIDLRWYR